MSDNGAEWPDDIDKTIEEVDWTAELADMNDFNDLMDTSLTEVREWLEGETDPDPINGRRFQRGSVLFGIYMLALARMQGFGSATDLLRASPELHDMYTEIIHGLLAQGVLLSRGSSVMMVTPPIADYLDLRSYGDNGAD